MALPPDPNSLGDAWGFGKGVASGVGDGIKSAVEGVADLAKGGYALATDEVAREQAWQTAKQLARAGKDYAGRAYDDPAQAFTDAKDGANRLKSAFEQARDAAAARGESAEFWGQAVGRAGFEVAALLAPVGAATKLGKLAEGAKTADQLVDGIRAADTLVDGGRALSKVEAALARATAAASDAGYEVLPCGRMVSKAELAGGVSDAVKAARASREAVAMEYFTKEMGLPENDARKLLNGIDLDKAVEIVDVPPPDEMVQLVRKSHGNPGNWFNPDPAQSADMVGLNGDPAIRELKTFKTPAGKALKSTAAPVIDNWTSKADAVFTKGGGVQMTVTDAMREAFGKGY
jgi:hypothetical protein